jgi:hypothetical protein
LAAFGFDQACGGKANLNHSAAAETMVFIHDSWMKKLYGKVKSKGRVAVHAARLLINGSTNRRILGEFSLQGSALDAKAACRLADITPAVRQDMPFPTQSCGIPSAPASSTGPGDSSSCASASNSKSG